MSLGPEAKVHAGDHGRTVAGPIEKRDVSDMKYCIGVDIGGTKCAVLLAGLSNGIRLLSKIQFPTEAKKGFHHTKNNIFTAIRRILVENNLSPHDAAAIGVSCGGPLDSEKGLILSPPNLPGWDSVPFTEMLTKEFGIPAFLQNDANACALVEWKLGAGRGTRNMVFLTMGTGMGAGIIEEGMLLRGENDMAGEIGHVRMAQEGPVGFGKAGSFEGFCSGGGIGRYAQQKTREWLDAGKEPVWIRDGIPVECVDAKTIGDYADRGDEDAKEIYRFAGEKLGEGISILIDVLNPEKVVIGGVFGRSENQLRPSMLEAIRREALKRSAGVCEVVPAETGEKLGDYASIIAACYAMGIDPAPEEETSPAVLRYYEDLFVRYPDLEPARVDLMRAYLLLRRTYQRGGKLLLCGNGGSASDCGHIVGELMKSFRFDRPLNKALAGRIAAQFGPENPGAARSLCGALPAVSLCEHTSFFTAFCNDADPSMAFAQQVIGYGAAGDALFAISTSGNSRNVLNAVLAAKAVGLNVIGLTGKDGGKLKALCDAAICVPGGSTAEIQERHLPVYHALCSMLEEYFFDVSAEEKK